MTTSLFGGDGKEEVGREMTWDDGKKWREGGGGWVVGTSWVISSPLLTKP